MNSASGTMRPHHILFACLAGVFFVFAELALMASTPSRFLTLTVSFSGCFLTGLVLMIATRSYRLCSVFVLSSGISMSLIAMLVLWLDLGMGVDNETFYLIAVNWAGPVIACVAVRMLDRKEHFTGFDSFFRQVSGLFFIIYLFGMIALLFFGSVNRGTEQQSINLIPFRTIQLYWDTTALSLENKLQNLFGNIAVFVPFGFYLGVFSRKVRLWLCFLLVVAVPSLVEVLQYRLHVGVCDVDDVILNAIGGLLGLFLYFLLERIFRALHGKDQRLFRLGR